MQHKRTGGHPFESEYGHDGPYLDMHYDQNIGIDARMGNYANVHYAPPRGMGQEVYHHQPQVRDFAGSRGRRDFSAHRIGASSVDSAAAAI